MGGLLFLPFELVLEKNVTIATVTMPGSWQELGVAPSLMSGYDCFQYRIILGFHPVYLLEFNPPFMLVISPFPGQIE